MSNNKRTPIGFVTLPSPATHITWTPKEYVNILKILMNNLITKIIKFLSLNRVY